MPLPPILKKWIKEWRKTSEGQIETDEIKDLAVTRSKLEYPTEDVSFAYLVAIEKAEQTISIGHTDENWFISIVTVDSFADKGVIGTMALSGDVSSPLLRFSSPDTTYLVRFDPDSSTADVIIRKCDAGTFTDLATEAVDITNNRVYNAKASISGSTIKVFRSEPNSLTLPDTPNVSATDTGFTSGKFGVCVARSGPYMNQFNPYSRLIAPATSLPKAKAVMEVEIATEGGIKPSLVRDLKEISQLSGLPDFLYREAKKYEILRSKGFTDEEIKLLFGDIQTHVDLASVTWGAFDHKPQHNTMLIMITGGNAYTGEKAIQEQIEHAKSKGLKVLSPPRDYNEAIEQYRQLKRDFPEWIAGCHNYCFQTLGHEDFDAMQVADTYHGNIIDGIKPDAYKNVPDWEMRKTLQMWKERLKKAEILKIEAEKHLKKLEEVEKKGW